jgi:hypothetical protein
VQCAWAASRKKVSYLQAQFQRLRHRRGLKKVVCAVAASDAEVNRDSDPFRQAVRQLRTIPGVSDLTA